jgi:hypothetical protein
MKQTLEEWMWEATGSWMSACGTLSGKYVEADARVRVVLESDPAAILAVAPANVRARAFPA